MPSTVNKSDVSPGLTSHLLARAMAALVERDAAPSSGNVRHPATAHESRRIHWRLMGCRQVSKPAKPSRYSRALGTD
jgi:hypothetical protein